MQPQGAVEFGFIRNIALCQRTGRHHERQPEGHGKEDLFHALILARGGREIQ